MLKRIGSLMAVVAVFACAVTASAEVVIDTVTIGNPGNAGELSGGPAGDPFARITGAVDYVYDVSKYEVTAGQYTEFLNAVAATDTYALYDTKMIEWDEGCKIQRSGTSGSYAYSVAGEWANYPVNFVSYGDSARFANWLHNGQPTGAQDLSTTEDGAYYLNGAMSDAELVVVNRESDWRWAITTEDEWYKAAYHKNDGVTGNYFDYPTSSDDVPSNDLVDPDPGNNANFRASGFDFTVGPPNYRTEVGEFENSSSPYGTFDQGGNMFEWTESLWSDGVDDYRGIRGGSWFWGEFEMRAMNSRFLAQQSGGSYMIGIRLSTIPEPASFLMLCVAGLIASRRR
ncbi:MAG: SUMF1/EgtB/PvdO family nonheme iron enzyme [Phycisphaerae bacterium]